VSTIKLDPKRLEGIRQQIENIKNDLDFLSGDEGGNSTSNLIFEESSGKTVETYKSLIQEIEKASVTMSNVVIKTENYLKIIIDGFEGADSQIADEIQKSYNTN